MKIKERPVVLSETRTRLAAVVSDPNVTEMSQPVCRGGRKTAQHNQQIKLKGKRLNRDDPGWRQGLMIKS